MKKSHIGRRRGTSVAAAALSFALVAPFAQPVAFAAETGSEVNTVDGHTAKCGLDPNDPMVSDAGFWYRCSGDPVLPCSG